MRLTCYWESPTVCLLSAGSALLGAGHSLLPLLAWHKVPDASGFQGLKMQGCDQERHQCHNILAH